MKKINTSLALEEVVNKAYSQRVKHDKLYLNYKDNPFTVKQAKDNTGFDYNKVPNELEETETQNFQATKKFAKQKTIVEALNNIKASLKGATFSQLGLKPAKPI